MRISSLELAGLYDQLNTYAPRLEVVAVRCPDQEVPPTFVPPAQGSITGAAEFAYIADRNEDGLATIQIKVEVINGDYRGKESDFIDPPVHGAPLTFSAANPDGSGYVEAITAVAPEAN